MSTTELKTRIVKKIRTISDRKILAELDILLAEIKLTEGSDFWDELSSGQKKNVETSIKQIRGGRSIPHHQVQEELKQWLKK